MRGDKRGGVASESSSSHRSDTPVLSYATQGGQLPFEYVPLVAEKQTEVILPPCFV